MAADSRRVEFGKPARAVHIKLTGPLYEALTKARNSGEKVTMDVGTTNVSTWTHCLGHAIPSSPLRAKHDIHTAMVQVITVGEQQFKFQAHDVGLQDIIRIPAARSQPCTEVATVTHRLHVQVWRWKQAILPMIPLQFPLHSLYLA